MQRFNVAVSVTTDPNANIWSSGINQNLAFLVQLLRRSPAVDKLWLVHQGEDERKLPPALELGFLDVPLVARHEITHEVDLVLEFGAALQPEWLRRVRAIGGKVVVFLVGHPYAGQAESAIFDRPGASSFIGSPWDEVWMLPNHMKTGASMMRTVSRAPVVQMPHLWSPHFLLASARQAETPEKSFGFRAPLPGRPRPWRLAIFEPNISVVKNCFIPLFICDQAYRDCPEAVQLMMALNTMHMKEHRTFNSIARHLQLTRDSKAWYEPRLAFAPCMTEHQMDCVVSHHWENGLNYLYYDALYGGYPLVHNSEWLRDAGMGFFYPGFAAREGARQLVDAWRHTEAGYWEGYLADARKWLKTLAPGHPANVEAFTRQITHVMSGGGDGQG